MDTTVAPPEAARTVSRERRVRLADMDCSGRVRLDALARFLQDIAIDDVGETGWGEPEHLWFVRRMRVDVVTPFVADRILSITTWCSGMAPLAAGRRWSARGDRGGVAEVDSVWVHLDADVRPARIENFGVYEIASAGRPVSTRFVLPDPPPGAAGSAWQLRSSDVDRFGHVNNAVYWQMVEDRLVSPGHSSDGRGRWELEFRQALDWPGAPDVLAYSHESRTCLAVVDSCKIVGVAAFQPL